MSTSKVATKWIGASERLPELSQPLRGELELPNMESELVEIECDLGIIKGRLVYDEPAPGWADEQYMDIDLWNIRRWREVG